MREPLEFAFESDLDRLNQVLRDVSEGSVFLCGGTVSQGSIQLHEGLAARLRELEFETRERGIGIDVRPEVLARFIEQGPKSDEEAAARNLLARAWDESLAENPRSVGLSLSHSRGHVLAVARATTSGRAGIGVDIELSGRRADPRIEQRIRHPGDRLEGLPLLAYWAVKEALLKVDLATLAAPLSSYEVRVQRESPSLWTGVGRSMESSQFQLVIAIDHIVVAVALA